MTPIHSARWLAAQQSCRAIIHKATSAGALIFFQGEFLPPTKIVIGATRIVVRINQSVHILYEADPAYDHGLYDRASVTTRRLQRTLRVFKEI
jgi:transposase